MKKTLLNIFTICLVFVATVTYANTTVYFSPKGGCQDVIVAEISRAQKTIDIAMYYFTSREIAQELVKAKDRKVNVRIVLDKSQETHTYSKSRYLISRGFDVRYYIGAGLMHNKYAIIDDKIVITGSYNWTASADDKNEENLLVMTDKTLINTYQKRFEYLWKKSKKVK